MSIENMRPTRKAKESANERMNLPGYNSFVSPMPLPPLHGQVPGGMLHLSPTPGQMLAMSPSMPTHMLTQHQIPIGLDGTVGNDVDEELSLGGAMSMVGGQKRDNGDVFTGPPPVGVKRVRRGVTSGKESVEDEENSLYGAVRSGRMAPQALVDDWIEQYKTNRDAALLELMQFFVSCSGCKGRITAEMYSRDSHTDIIRKMTEEFDEDGGEYPLIMAGPTWRKFRGCFVDFVQVLIRQCQYSIIYDQYMMDVVISLITGLTDSQVRAFRHTSTLAAMKLMTALVDVALNVSINMDNTQRQYESERNKAQNRRAPDRLEQLMSKRQELEENMEEIKNMLTYIFKGVFVHRYRDSQPEIRSVCMQEIGLWMRRMPAVFLDDSYLKYVGWTLYDRVGEVRHQCLKSLQPLYENPEIIARLELFTSRFKARLVDMTLDKDNEVAVQAVKVATSVLKHSDSILEDKDCENIYELVYSSHKALAQAAADFLNHKLFQIDEHAPITKSKKGKKRSENTPLIRDLVQFFIESELHEHAAYLVDSLWEINEMLRDWECMLDLLIEEPGRGEEALDDRQESSLIEILTCCVRQAASGESPVGRQPPRRQLTQKETKAIAEERARLTEALIIALPQLLMKFNADTEKMINLLSLPLHMELEMYTTNRQEKHLDLLLKYVQEAVEKHTEADVLNACARVFETVTSEDLSISTKCRVVADSMVDHLVDEAYRNAFMEYLNEEEPDEDEVFALLSSLKRIYAFYSCLDLTRKALWNSLITVIKTAQTRRVWHEEIVAKGLACGAFALLWAFKQLDESNPDRNKVKAFRKMLNLYMSMCQNYLSLDSKRIVCEAFVSLCDNLVIFNRHLSSNEDLKSLVYEPSRKQEESLANFLERFVFVGDDETADENQKIEELHNRRTHLACFCKLIIYNVLPVRSLSVILKHYIRYYNDFGDIMKTTLQKAREINKIAAAKTMVRCLEQEFLDYVKSMTTDAGLLQLDRGSESFIALKDLARRFNLSFGLDAARVREQLMAIHQDGVQFSLQSWTAPPSSSDMPTTATMPGLDPPPPNIYFFDILAEFTNKLLKNDKKFLLDYLSRQMAPVQLDALPDSWQPLQLYRCSLDQELAGEHLPGVRGVRGAGRGRVVKRGRDSDVASVVGAGGGNSVTATPGRPVGSASATAVVDSGATPGFAAGVLAASTAVKRRRMSTHSAVAVDIETSAIDEPPPVQYSSRGRLIRPPVRAVDVNRRSHEDSSHMATTH